MYDFFAFINRMKYIERWGLMRNIVSDNLQEHCFQTAMLAHALCFIDNKLHVAIYDNKDVFEAPSTTFVFAPTISCLSQYCST